MPKIKKLLLRANCPVNEYWDVGFFCVTLTEESVALLLRQREASMAFLQTQEANAFYGKVELDCPLSFTVSNDEAGMDILDQAGEGTADNGDGEDIAFAPDDFEPNGDDHVRTELHVTIFFKDGGMWLQATSKDSADYVEAELHLELLTEGLK